MQQRIADELEVFVEVGPRALWDPALLGDMVVRLTAETEATDDPLPNRIGRFLEAVRLRQRVAEVDPPMRAEIEAIVYPRVWKVIEGIRDGMPDAEFRTRIEVMNRRLARLFVDESVGERQMPASIRATTTSTEPSTATSAAAAGRSRGGGTT